MSMRNPPYASQGERAQAGVVDIGAEIARIAKRSEVVRLDRDIARVTAQDMLSLNKRNAVNQILYDLSNAVCADASGKVYRIVHALQGTTPGAIVTLVIPGGGQVDLYPGDYFVGPLDSFQLVRHANSVTSGNARMVLCREPDAEFNNIAQRTGSGGIIERVDSTQSYNSTANTPTLATDGIAITSDSALRVIINGSNHAMPGTITGGTVRYWFYDPTLAAWALSTIEYTLPTGVRYVALPDEVIGVSEGRFFPEIRSLTTSLANGSPVASMRTIGN